MGACCSKIEADVQQQQEAGEQDATGGLSDMYEVKHLLGSGSAGDTWLCRDRATGELLAVKLMKRPIPKVMGANIMREVKIGAQLGKGHLNIVKPKELILTRTHLGIVMEYIAGGNMADYILKTILLKFGSFDTRDGLVMEEDEARYFFTQVINAVDYCHQNKVAHRDLKMDNTLLDDNDPPRIKLCDFGFAKWWTDKPSMCTITGTPDYMSPELLGAKALHQAQALYDGTKADIWAAGVMLCVMLIGRFPFEGIEMSSATNLEEVSEHVWRQQNSQRWYDNPLICQDCMMLSPDCMDLLNKIFNLDMAKRITIPEIRQHPWFVQALPQPYSQARTDLLAEQATIDAQVKSGVFVSSNRDAALMRMIEAAAFRYSPEREAELLQPPQEPGAAQTSAGGSLARLSASVLRKISLSSIRPFQGGEADGAQVTLGGQVTLEALNDRFSMANGAGAGPDGLPSGSQAPGTQQQLQLGVQQQAGRLTDPDQQQQQQAAGIELQQAAGWQQQQPQPPQPPPLQAEQQQQQQHQQQQHPVLLPQHAEHTQQGIKQQQAHNSSSSGSQQHGLLVGPVGGSSGQPPGYQVEAAGGTLAPAAAGTALADAPQQQLSTSEIQVT